MENHVSYDTYCGLYCGACEIMKAYQTKDYDSVREKWPVDSEQIVCHGCKSDTVFINCQQCEIRKCAMDKKVDVCADCGDFPCDIYSKGKDFIKDYPHLQIIPKNLKDIKAKGVKQWLEEQKAKWSCPECGVNFTWYQQNCGNCGQHLTDLKDYNKLDQHDLRI